MGKQILSLLVALLSLSIILERNQFWLKLWPVSYWRAQIAELEKDEQRNRWKVHELEWNQMRARIEVTIAVSAAEEKADCLRMDKTACIEKARGEALFHLHQIEHELTGAKEALADTNALLVTARTSLLLLEQRPEQLSVDGSQLSVP